MNVMNFRATVSLQVVQINILGLLFLLVSHMNQEIETITIWITGRNGQELLPMKQNQFMNLSSKGVQKESALFAVDVKRW